MNDEIMNLFITALGVVIKIPVPKQTAKTSFQVTSGRAKYKIATDCLIWK